MRTLQISLECGESENVELNFALWRRIYLGQSLETYTLSGLSPFSTLILTLYQSPLRRRVYSALVLSWYGYLLGLTPPDDLMQKVLALFEKYVQPHSADPKVYVQRAVSIWETLLVDSEKDVDLTCEIPPTLKADTLPPHIPHTHAWMVIQGSEKSILWRRSEVVENPLLMDLLREVQDRYGVLPIWSKHDEGEYILYPLLKSVEC